VYHKKTFLSIILVWVIVTSINLFKPVHIDDTFHLIAASHILEEPLSPMSGEVLWDHTPSKIKDFNQPPLFFYCMALTMKLFGESVITLHLMLSIFSLLALFFISKISHLIGVRKANLPLLIIGLSPAFIVNQNIMVDIPLLSLILASVYFYLKGNSTNYAKQYIFSGIFLSLALLTKYTAIPVFIAIFLFSILRKNYKALLSLFIPIMGLVIWSVFNYYEFNSVHLFNRGSTDIEISTLLSYTACLGSIGFFFPLFLSRLSVKRIVFTSVAYLLLLILLAIGVYSESIKEDQSNFVLNIVFSIIGLTIILITVYEFYKQSSIDRKWYRSEQFLFVLIGAGLFLFTSLFAPFCATRHLLLVIPFLIFANLKLINQATKKAIILSVFLTAFFGVTLGISDLRYANFYQEQAKLVPQEIINGNQTIWTKGYWGWQWYASKNGMTLYHWNRQDINKGDYFIFPAQVASQYVTEEIQLDTLDIVEEQLDPLTFISTKNARFYHSSYKKPAWNFSIQSRDSIIICKVKDGIDLKDVRLRIKRNADWFNSIKEKAKDKNISVDSALTLDAIWSLENQ
jgi:hypothetical protein